MMDFEGRFPLPRMRIVEVFNELPPDLLWDINVMSHADVNGDIRRAVEVIIYHDAKNRHDEASDRIVRWCRSSKLRFRHLREVEVNE